VAGFKPVITNYKKLDRAEKSSNLYKKPRFSPSSLIIEAATLLKRSETINSQELIIPDTAKSDANGLTNY